MKYFIICGVILMTALAARSSNQTVFKNPIPPMQSKIEPPNAPECQPTKTVPPDPSPQG